MATEQEMEDRATQLRVFMSRHGIQVKSKRDKATHWWHAIVLWFGALLVPNFNQRYSTTVGRTMYMSHGISDRGIDLTDELVYRIVRHEIIHILDSKRFPVLFSLTYALLLPTVLTMRAFWEVRGYTQNLLVRYELMDEGDDWNRIVENEIKRRKASFKRYFFMLPFPRWVSRMFRSIADDIVAGKIKGYYPYKDELNEQYEPI